MLFAWQALQLDSKTQDTLVQRGGARNTKFSRKLGEEDPVRARIPAKQEKDKASAAVYTSFLGLLLFVFYFISLVFLVSDIESLKSFFSLQMEIHNSLNSAPGR